ncbi:MAG: Uma2 family endonuclease [Chloroflexota bacterium]
MVQTPWRHPPLTKEQENTLFMLLLEDDREDAPWMVMGDLQFWSASDFAQSLCAHAREEGLAWYVAAMLPITFEWPGVSGKKTLAPDTLVSFVPDRARGSYDLAVEGAFPPFVLEVVSPASTNRDHEEKRQAYDLLGAREYALFTPRAEDASTLDGFRRGRAGAFEPWPADDRGRLWSNVLELYLVVRGTLVQAETRDGQVLLTPQQEAERRRRAEEEVDRLRRELNRLKGESSDNDPGA